MNTHPGQEWVRIFRLVLTGYSGLSAFFSYSALPVAMSSSIADSVVSPNL
jgi:hypothetical protein